MSSPIVGIDLGTTNSLIGAMDAGFPILIADSDGERLTPSVVHFPHDGDPLCGPPSVVHSPQYGQPRAAPPAARMRAVDPRSTVYSAKRFIGRRVGEESDDVSYALAGAPGTPVKMRVGLHDYSPEEI